MYLAGFNNHSNRMWLRTQRLQSHPRLLSQEIRQLPMTILNSPIFHQLRINMSRPHLLNLNLGLSLCQTSPKAFRRHSNSKLPALRRRPKVSLQLSI
jgi:hypothetical protein